MRTKALPSDQARGQSQPQSEDSIPRFLYVPIQRKTLEFLKKTYSPKLVAKIVTFLNELQNDIHGHWCDKFKAIRTVMIDDQPYTDEFLRRHSGILRQRLGKHYNKIIQNLIDLGELVRDEGYRKGTRDSTQGKKYRQNSEHDEEGDIGGKCKGFALGKDVEDLVVHWGVQNTEKMARLPPSVFKID